MAHSQYIKNYQKYKNYDNYDNYDNYHNITTWNMTAWQHENMKYDSMSYYYIDIILDQGAFHKAGLKTNYRPYTQHLKVLKSMV